jgi:hypothetical protein
MSINIGNFVESGRNIAKNAINSFTDSLDGSSGGGGNAFLTFPPYIRGQKDHLPLIEFTAYERNPSPGNIEGKKKPGTGFHQIYLPINSNITFNDGSAYNTINLSSIGAKTTQTITETNQSTQGLLSSMASAVSDARAAIAASFVPGGAGDYLGLRSGVISNPNTNTTFEGNIIRTFEFTFKLIAQSQQEASIIKKIHETFRYFSYADLNTENSNLFLSYPAPWTIRFIDGTTGQENQYIPGIWSCYLTTVNSTFNSSSNMYFKDNAPLEVDISLSFQETRVLNRNDLMSIKEDKLRGIINGKPSTIIPSEASTENIENVGGD